MGVAYREPIAYNFAVVRSLAKQVYVAEGLAPPKSVAEVKAAYREIWESALKWRQLNFAKVGVYALEAYGIFKVGNFYFIFSGEGTEMIGSRLGRYSEGEA